MSGWASTSAVGGDGGRYVDINATAMRWGNRDHIHADGNISALRFSSESSQDTYGAKWLRSLIGTPWRDKGDAPERGLSMSDMAVLVRTRKEIAPIAAALRSVGLDVLAQGQDSLLLAPEAEALATAADFLAGVRSDPQPHGGISPIVSQVSDADVRRTAIRAGLALTDSAVDNGLAFLTEVKARGDRRSLCLIEILEDYLQALGYHAAFDGETDRYTQPDGVTIPHSHGRCGELAWLAISRILNAAADFQRFGFSDPFGVKIARFAMWLRLEAPLAYTGDDRSVDSLRVNPDAVTVMTTHGAKGLEWPVVWVPDLIDGRFPSRRWMQGARIWDVLAPKAMTTEQKRRANGTEVDEHRLAYVTVTRSAAYLLATYAPPAGWRDPQPSPYLLEMERSLCVNTNWRVLPEPARRGSRRLEPTPKEETRTIQLTFSQLFNYWTCPRSCYLRFLLGFPPPVALELGYGQSLHQAASEIHSRVKSGERLSEGQLAQIAERHFHLPYADASLATDLRTAAIGALQAYHHGYIVENEGRIAYVEKEVRVDVGPITLVGRIDLARELPDGSIAVAELKTEEAASRDEELFAYGLGFAAETGQLPGFVETRRIRADAGNDTKARRLLPMMTADADEVKERIRAVGDNLAGGHFPARPIDGTKTCAKCDVRRICWRGQRETGNDRRPPQSVKPNR